jgi:ribosomal protein S18 acetylase RimI-like enzyme
VGTGEEEVEEERIVGFLLAQVFDAGTAEDADLFFPSLLSPKRVCYVLTLGFIPEYRRTGLASLFILKLRNDMELDPYCGAVYLHVITTNTAALRFYSHNDFLCLRSLQG